MLKMPANGLTDEAKRNLQRFYHTSAAREIEGDARSWTVTEWTWGAGPPLRVQLRDETGGDVIAFVMDDAGLWTLCREPIEPKIAVPSDLSRQDATLARCAHSEASWKSTPDSTWSAAGVRPIPDRR